MYINAKVINELTVNVWSRCIKSLLVYTS